MLGSEALASLPKSTALPPNPPRKGGRKNNNPSLLHREKLRA